jgi:hypothetical protein
VIVIFGITPIESAFEAMGLHNAFVIIRYLFIGSPFGAIAFAIGFFFSLSSFLKTKRISVLISYLALSCIIYILFVVPSSTLTSVSSTMESNSGSEVLSSQELFNESTSNNSVPSTLLFVSRCYNSLIIGVIGVLDLIVNDSDFSYLKSPFLMNKIMIQTRRFLEAEISDPDLNSRLNNFITEHYLPTLNKMEEDGEITVENGLFVWPGADIVVNNYGSHEGEWDDILEDLRIYARGDLETSRLFEKYSSHVNRFVEQNGNNVSIDEKDKIVLFLLNKKLLVDSTRDSISKKADNVLYSKGKKKGFKFSTFSYKAMTDFVMGSAAKIFVLGGQFIGNFFSVTGLYYFLIAYPFVQGYLVLILYTLFPSTIVFALVSGRANYFGLFLKTLFYVKSWNIILAVINNASKSFLEIQAKVSPDSGFLFEFPVFNTVTFVLLLASPVISYYFSAGILNGVSGLAGSVGSTGVSGINKLKGLTKFPV